MINWYNLFANSLWILALALALSVFSFARWEAKAKGVRLKDEINHPKWQISLNLAGVLFCGGLAATTSQNWERILWGVIGMLFMVQIGTMSFLNRKK